jgi:hypothetical protein
MDAFWNGPNENVQCIELREINPWSPIFSTL